MNKSGSYAAFAVFVILSFGWPALLPAQIPGATAERLAQKNFFPLSSTIGNISTASVNRSGWTASGSGTVDAELTYTFLGDNSNTQTFTQSVTNANLTGKGAVVTLVMTANKGLNGSSANGAGSQLSIVYRGTTYATVATATGFNTTATMTYSPGASGNLSTQSFAGSPTFTWQVYLPLNIPNDGSLQLIFDPGGSSSATAADDFTIFSASFLACPIVYTGTVIDDANGAIDGLINGPGAGLSGLSVGLYDGSNNLRATGAVSSADGTYSLSYAQTGTYTLRLAGLPSSYVNTGERITMLPPDGTPDGITAGITINDAINNSDKSGNDFGIDGLPTANGVIKTVTGPPAFTNLSMPPLNGSDPEDQPAAGSWLTKTFVVTVAPSNGFILKYNGAAVTVGASIPTYTPSSLTIEPGGSTPGGTISTSFQYKVVDVAGKTAVLAATYTINWTITLPVVLTGFEARAIQGNALLSWTADNQANFREYEIERSSRAGSFVQIGTVAGNGLSSGDYSYTNTGAAVDGPLVNYRLRMVDIDGKTSYSDIRSLRFETPKATVIVAPTIVSGGQPLAVWISGSPDGDSYDIRLISLTGVTMGRYRMVSPGKLEIATAGLPKGMYLVWVESKGGQQVVKVVVQ